MALGSRSNQRGCGLAGGDCGSREAIRDISEGCGQLLRTRLGQHRRGHTRRFGCMRLRGEVSQGRSLRGRGLRNFVCSQSGLSGQGAAGPASLVETARSTQGRGVPSVMTSEMMKSPTYHHHKLAQHHKFSPKCIIELTQGFRHNLEMFIRGCLIPESGWNCIAAVCSRLIISSHEYH
jgi:hypothetical protein